LQFFVAAAEAGSVTGAARVLSISQSSVTEAIRALEDDLGVQLFDRQARGLEITHKGQAFLRHARQILADVASRPYRLSATKPKPRPGGCRWA
jgi:DNA-binding transcriptional LysR family regulator